jgi:AraC family transcriptional regulator of adaptative response / DNA-3-methyladenine glycosylase II
LGSDALLAPLVEARPGLRRPGAFDGFELAMRAVLGQQVTVAGASTLAGRLVAIAGEPLDAPSQGITHLFPSPDQVAEADLSGLGIPAARRKTIRGLAEEVASGRLVLDGSEDLDETTDRLLALPGIGSWTASYIAMRALGEDDAFPAGDLGLQRASSKLGGPATASGLRARAERWRPWRAYAALHLWTSSSDRRESRL